MTDNQIDDDATDVAVGSKPLDIRNLSQIDLGRLGLQQIAYVKPVTINGVSAFAIHAADGTPMAVAQNEDLALAAIVQHEMLPALVH
jgi:hypothetical protein